MPNGQTITLTVPEGKLFIRTLAAVVDFAESYPLDFQAFCNPETFKNVLMILGRAERDVEAQLKTNASVIRVSSLALPALLDLEECLSAAKTARVENSRVALFTSIGGGVLSSILGLSFLATVSSVAAISILVLGPFSKASQAPKEAISPDISELRGGAC